jgi:hypothetical protein
MRVVVAAGMLAAALFAPAPASAGHAVPTPCAAVAARGPQGGHVEPPPAPALFPPDFPVVHDCEWGFRLGGWGGVRRHAPLHHVPVIFVHGNHVDAANWFAVADRFHAAGYSDQELYAVSYNGLGSPVDGAPTCCAPSPADIAYWQRPDAATNMASGGVAAGDDANVPDVYHFVRAVQSYTGSMRVDIVAHSLGVTIVRKMMFDHPELYHQVQKAVMIAGGNHGTSLCRVVLEHSYYGCNEIKPGSSWLARLNSRGEAPGPTRWMTVYNGHDSADPFFDQGPGFDDRQSPHLDGAINCSFAGVYHNDLRADPVIVSVYLAFLLGKPLPTIAPGASPQAPQGGGCVPPSHEKDSAAVSRTR